MSRLCSSYLAVLTVGCAWLVGGASRLSAQPAEPVKPASAGKPETATPPAGPQIQELADAAKRFRSGDHDGALALLKTAARKYPDLPPAQVLLGNLFAQINQLAMVQAALEQAVREAPDDPEAYVIMADLALQNGRILEASLLYDKTSSVLRAFQGSPKRKAAIKTRIEGGLAAVADANKDWAKAQKHLDAVLADEPKNAIALLQYGRILFQQNKPDEALEKFRQAAKANANVMAPEVNLARLCEQAGDRAGATKWFVAAIKASPRDLKVRLAAAQWSLDTEQLNQAQDQADAALKIDADSLDANFLRGVVAMFLKDYPGAAEYFEKAHAISPGNFAAGNNLALALAEQDDAAKKRRALEYAEVNARTFPRQPESFSTLGWVCYKLGRLDDAEKALRQASSLGRVGPDALYYMARVLVDRQKKADAAQLLESALRTPNPFTLRKEAEALLEELNKKEEPKKKLAQ